MSIAEVDFIESAPQNIFVEEDFRLQGVAKSMCVLAIKILGKPLEDVWEDSDPLLTSNGKALWRRLKPLRTQRTDESQS